jgi:hypothetical protein
MRLKSFFCIIHNTVLAVRTVDMNNAGMPLQTISAMEGILASCSLFFEISSQKKRSAQGASRGV